MLGRYRLERDGSSAGLSSDAIHLQMGMMNVAKEMINFATSVVEVWHASTTLRSTQNQGHVVQQEQEPFPQAFSRPTSMTQPHYMGFTLSRKISKDFLQTPPNSTQQADLGCSVMDGTISKQRDHKALTENSLACSQQGEDAGQVHLRVHPRLQAKRLFELSAHIRSTLNKFFGREPPSFRTAACCGKRFRITFATRNTIASLCATRGVA